MAMEHGPSLRMLTRRRFLHRLSAGSALLGGAAVLTACGGSAGTAVSSLTASAATAVTTTATVSSAATTASSQTAAGSTVASSAPAVASKAAAAGGRTLTIWHIWNGTREPLVKRIAADFTKQHPQLAVDEQVITTDLLTKITAGIAAGTPCDMAMINQGWVPAMATQSAITALDPLVARDKVDLNIFYASALAPGKWGGKLYVLPDLGAGAYPVLFYNKDLLQQQGISQPPATWSELHDAMQKLTISKGGAISQLGGVPAYSDNTINFMQLLVANSGAFLSSDNRTFTFDDAPGLDALTFFQSFYDGIGGTAAVAAFQKSQGSGEKNTPFFKGTQAMDLSGVWYVFQIKNDNPNLNYGIAPAPHGPQAGAKYQSPNFGQWSYGIPTGVKSVDDSWLLTQWFTTTKDEAGWFMEQQLRPSPLQAVNADPYYQQQTVLWPDIAKLLPATIPVGPTPVDPQVQKLLGAMMSDVLAKKVDPKAALDNTQKQAQALLDKWYADHPGA
ncbi:MAG TPA: extracellular solute-binding protein [Chloroflexota bacterium]|jgi:ABC-type glycerol-3-phosphate transport system substrate-binding protein|nr:extracellular solute-binding protein [Chloroflexota bacterium]